MDAIRRYEPNIDYNKYFFDVLSSYANKNLEVLDLGTGKDAKVISKGSLLKLCKYVAGIDINSDTIKNLQTKYKNFGNVKFTMADSTKKTSLSSASFGVITALFSPFSLKEVKRLLKPNGTFIAMFALPGDHSELRQVLPELFETKTWATLAATNGKDLFAVFENSELKEKEIYPVFNLGFKYKWFFPNTTEVQKFYSYILDRDVPISQLKKLKQINKEIPITRKIGLVVLKKLPY